MKASRTMKMVVSAAPTSTTNITGFLASVTGFSFANDAANARPRSPDRITAGHAPVSSAEEKSGLRATGTGWGGVAVVDIGLEQLSLMHKVMLHDRPEGKRGEEGQSADNHDRADQQAYK